MSGTEHRKRTGRPTKADAAKLRERLLRFAFREFLKLGYANTSIDSISALSGISKTTIYRHFSSKSELFRAVAIRSGRSLNQDLANVVTEDRPVADVLRDFALISYDDPASPDMLAMTRLAVGEAARFPDVAYAAYLHRREMIQPIIDYFRALDRDGKLLIKDPPLSAYQFVAMASGGIRVLLAPREMIDANRERWVNATVEVFMHGHTGQKHNQPVCAVPQDARDR